MSAMSMTVHHPKLSILHVDYNRFVRWNYQPFYNLFIGCLNGFKIFCHLVLGKESYVFFNNIVIPGILIKASLTSRLGLEGSMFNVLYKLFLYHNVSKVTNNFVVCICCFWENCFSTQVKCI